jgi:UDP-N-acetylmuramoyl-tripeptide--D-alanyl-D-alanine ligase
MDGALFIALCGDNFDAHDYVKQAQKMGAVALLVSKKVKSSLPTLVVETQLKVIALSVLVATSVHAKESKGIYFGLGMAQSKISTSYDETSEYKKNNWKALHQYYPYQYCPNSYAQTQHDI